MNRPADTSVEAEERQLEALRAMTPVARLYLAEAMSSDVRSLTRAGIRARHPEYSAERVEAQLAEILLGDGLAAAARRRRPVGAR